MHNRVHTNKNGENEKNEGEARSFPTDENEARGLFKERRFINFNIEGPKFFAYYSARNWAGVEDWRALAALWNERTLEFRKSGDGQSSLIPARPLSKPLGDETWKDRLISCSDCGKLIRAED
jgi:hypothetical protein